MAMKASTREQTHYKALGVPECADAATIKEAFRCLVLRHHPDKSLASDSDSFKSVQKAYNVLRDPAARKIYDDELRLQRQRKQSRFESAIVLEKSDCIVEEDEGGLCVLVYPCRCGAYLDTSPLEPDDDQKSPDGGKEQPDDDGLLECPGCSLVYDTCKLHSN